MIDIATIFMVNMYVSLFDTIQSSYFAACIILLAFLFFH